MSRPYAPEVSALPNATAPAIQLGRLALVGMLLAALQTRVDLSLGLPGHFGVFWMAGVLTLRLRTEGRFVAVSVALGYGLAALVFKGTGVGALVQLPGYLVAALIVDLLCAAPRTQLPGLARIALTGALAYAAKPATMVAVALLTGVAAPSLARWGLPMLLVTHAGFGAMGALGGRLLLRLLEPRGK